MAASSLGVRPTFGGGDRRLEAFLLDFEGDLYGDRVRVEFVKRLRDELRFASPEDLAEQIAKDVDQTRKALSERPLS
jgi:riboflavin kinase/FMN adenylyltransferase